MKTIFFFLSGVLTIIWGISHLIPTKNIVKNFGDLSLDNKRIITMEWINEGVFLIFIGSLTIMTSLWGGGLIVSNAVYVANAVILTVLSVVSMFTGFKVNFLPYKLCPVIFMVSAILILIGLIV